MTSNNPKHKPLHRIRNIRNAERNAHRFPLLADDVFNPVHAKATYYEPRDPHWQETGEGGVVGPIGMPPQPNMVQFYHAQDNNLNPRPFANNNDRLRHKLQSKTAGFIPFIKNGTNQFDAMMKLGIDPRIPPTQEELVRRAENEAKVQVFRDKMTLETIIENSGGGKWRNEGPFPGWDESQRELKAHLAKQDELAKAKAKAKAETKQKAEAEAEAKTI